MRAAVGTDQTSAVDGKAYGQILDRDIMDDLIVSALQEGRVNRTEWTHALRGEASREGHGMLFRDAHIERAFGVGGGEFVNAGPAGHGGSDRADFGVGFRKLGQRFAKHILIGRRPASGAFFLLAGNDVEFHHAMIFVVGRFGRGIAFALLRDDMD